MKESWSGTLWNEEIRIIFWMVEFAEKTREGGLRWYGHVIRRDGGEAVRDIME
jgi:hypothetical protein